MTPAYERASASDNPFGLGRDSDEIVSHAGYSADRIAELRQAGVIG